MRREVPAMTSSSAMRSIGARSAAVAPDSATADEDQPCVGVVTRSISWILDVVLINLAAIMVALGVALVTSVTHISFHHKVFWEVIAGALYVLWIGAYFIVFWTTTGQTPGARFMQIRLVTAGRQRVKPVRALVRWVGMQLAAIPLF